MKPSSKFDIIVYGATGFTGQLVAEYLAQHYTGDDAPKWAMAGRSLDKLASVRDAIGAPADTALIVADAGDPASLKAMVDQTRSVVSTVGPYQLYGSDLVAACAASGTDYLDLCGEPVWMRQMIDAHEATAWHLLCAARGQARVRRAGFPRQGPRARHARHALRRNGRKRSRDIRGGGQGSEPGGDPERSVCADARLSRTKTAEGQQDRL
jgi:hypothetical protein